MLLNKIWGAHCLSIELLLDDIVLVASKKGELKSMINRLEKYLDKRKLLANVEKSKVWFLTKEEEEGERRNEDGKIK